MVRYLFHHFLISSLYRSYDVRDPVLDGPGGVSAVQDRGGGDGLAVRGLLHAGHDENG